MEDGNAQISYLVFIKWLQANYPDLYLTSWKCISGDDDGININKEALDEKTYEALMEAKIIFNKRMYR